ncbi:MAG: polysaccharide biosynthesis tyrosine autokinase [Planctomycetota bacterium]|nr:polysaccharide biosynthesis tyrosine autokinase [Planctomycetota bacterium]
MKKNLTNRTSGASSKAPAPPGYDFVGAMVRRKGILLFFILSALPIGYFFFKKQPPKYSSSAKLMIWTQSPPTIVDGTAVVQPVPIGKHQSLLTSQVVLGNAVKLGGLDKLNTFIGETSAVGYLQKNLKAAPVEGAADTLLLTLKGPNPADLPGILSNIVTAYQAVVNEDTANIGKESVTLIGKLQEKLVYEKGVAESRFNELSQILSVTSDPRTGQFVNPFVVKAEQNKALLAAAERSKQEIEERITNITELQSVAVERRNSMLKIVALEASKYLALKVEEDPIMTDAKAESQERQRLVSMLESRMLNMESAISELDLRRSQYAKRELGERHPDILRLTTEKDFLETQLGSMREQKKKLEASIESQTEASRDKSAKEPSAAMAINKFETDLIRIYFDALKRELERSLRSIESMKLDIAEDENKATEISAAISELNTLSSEIKEKDSVLRSIVDRLSEIAVVANNYSSTKIRLIDEPGFGYQVEPVLPMFLSVAGMLGAMLGFGVILLLDWADMSFRSPVEIQDKLGLNVLARIPTMAKGKTMVANSLGMFDKDKQTSSVSEAYRSFRTALLFLSKEHNAKSILFTSPAAGDGKSTTVTHVAFTLAQAGYRTVIVDADMRRPRCHVYLGVDKGPGLKDLLDANGPFDHQKIIRKSALHENLSIVSAGGHPANPSEFIESSRFKNLLQDLREQFDFIIVDSPPVLPVSDATALSTICDAVVLVIKIRKGVELSSEKAVEMIRMVRGNLIGVIVNSVDKNSYYSDYGKYGYKGYGSHSYFAHRYYENENKKYYKRIVEPDKVTSEGS